MQDSQKDGNVNHNIRIESDDVGPGHLVSNRRHTVIPISRSSNDRDPIESDDVDLSRLVSNRRHTIMPTFESSDDNDPQPSMALKKFRKAVYAAVAISTTVEERGLGKKALTRFLIRICEQLDPELVELAAEVLAEICGKMEEKEFEDMKQYARTRLKMYCGEMRRGLNLLTVLAFAASCVDKKVDMRDDNWEQITTRYNALPDYFSRVLEMVQAKKQIRGDIHIYSEEDFRQGLLLRKRREVRPRKWTKREYKLEPGRGRYYGRTPWQYVLLTYIVLLGTVAVAGGLIAWWNKPRAEGIFEALQVVPLIDLFYFGIWKVFSYNDKIVRDLITGRWTIDSVEDFQRYFQMPEKEMFERIIGGDEQLGKHIESRYASYSPKPLIGLLPLQKPCSSALFAGWITHLIVNDAEFVVDWLNERVGLFHTVTSGYGSIFWIYEKDGAKFSSQPPLPRHRMRYTDIYAKTLVYERELRDVCDYIS